MSKENFKLFARNHPELSNFVSKGTTTWQKLYELYDIYGENSKIWDNYFLKDTKMVGDSTISDIMNTIRNVDLKSVQKTIENIQKTLGLIEGLGLGNGISNDTSTYESRPMYKYFED